MRRFRGLKNKRGFGAIALGAALLLVLCASDVELRRSASVAFGTAVASLSGPTAGYLPNEETRRSMARLDLGDLEAVYVNGEKLTQKETDEVIAALTLAERRAPGPDGVVPGGLGEAGSVEFRGWFGGKLVRPRVRFSVEDPARRYGPAFAHAIRDALRRGSYEAQVARSSPKTSP